MHVIPFAVNLTRQDEAWLVAGQMDPYPQGWFSPVYDQYSPSTTAMYSSQIPAGVTTTGWIIIYRPLHDWARSFPTATVQQVSTTSIDMQLEWNDQTFPISMPIRH